MNQFLNEYASWLQMITVPIPKVEGSHTCMIFCTEESLYKPFPCLFFQPHAIPMKEDSIKAASSNQNSGNNTGAEVSIGSKSKKTKGVAPTKKMGKKAGKKKGLLKEDKNKKNAAKGKPEDKSKSKLETTLLRLLAKLPKKNAVDASYLLDKKKRARKKSAKTKTSLPEDKDSAKPVPVKTWNRKVTEQIGDHIAQVVRQALETECSGHMLNYDRKNCARKKSAMTQMALAKEEDPVKPVSVKT